MAPSTVELSDHPVRTGGMSIAVGSSTLEHADHPVHTGGRFCQQVGSSLAVCSFTVERADHPARTGGRSCQQVLAVGSSPVDRTDHPAQKSRNILSTGGFFSGCLLLYSGACRSSSSYRWKVLSTCVGCWLLAPLQWTAQIIQHEKPEYLVIRWVLLSLLAPLQLSTLIIQLAQAECLVNR
jgi:hypothetical protein